jgi:hypothetical protein
VNANIKVSTKVFAPAKMAPAASSHDTRLDGNGTRKCFVWTFRHCYHLWYSNKGDGIQIHTSNRLSHLIRSHAFGLPSPRPAARLNLTWPRLQTCVPAPPRQPANQQNASPVGPRSPFATLHTLRPDSHSHNTIIIAISPTLPRPRCIDCAPSVSLHCTPPGSMR